MGLLSSTGTAAIDCPLEKNSWSGLSGGLPSSRKTSSFHPLSDPVIMLRNYIHCLEVTNISYSTAWNLPSDGSISTPSSVLYVKQLPASPDRPHSSFSGVGDTVALAILSFFRFSRSTAALLFLHIRGIFYFFTIAIPFVYCYCWQYLTTLQYKVPRWRGVMSLSVLGSEENVNTIGDVNNFTGNIGRAV